MDKESLPNKNIEDLPEFLIGKILNYMPLEDIFCSMQYANRNFRDMCEVYTRPKDIDNSKLTFLSTNQICQLIENSPGLKHFHFNGDKLPYESCTINPNVFKYLSKFSKSLERLTLTCTFIDHYADLLSLLTCGHQFKELVFRRVEIRNRFETKNHYGNFPSFDSLKKITFYMFHGLEGGAFIRILNKCPNVTHVTLIGNYVANIKKTVTHIFRQQRPQLKYFHFSFGTIGDSSQDMAKCINLRTLHISMIFSSLSFPMLPNISKLILQYSELSEEEYAKILKSFPNLRELTLDRTFDRKKPKSKCIAKCIAQMHNLRKITIVDTGMTKNDIFCIFRHCKSLKVARVDRRNLVDLCEDDISRTFVGLHTLQVVQMPLWREDDQLVKRLAYWLPQTQVYKVIAYEFPLYIPGEEIKRIWPDYCPF